MNADSINKWLTLVANIGVVIGLMLLLIELDQNSDLVRAQIHQARSDSWIGMKLMHADSEFLAPAIQKVADAGGMDNPAALDQLTSVEIRRIKNWYWAIIGDYDNLFYQYQQGYLDEDYYQSRIVPSIMNNIPAWKKLGIFEEPMRHSFRAEIDRMLSEN